MSHWQFICPLRDPDPPVEGGGQGGGVPPAASSDEVPPQEGGLGLDATVEVGGKQVLVRDLISSHQRVGELEQYRQHARRLMSSGEEPNEDWERATRFVMSDAGYDEATIDGYIEGHRNPPPTDEGGDDGDGTVTDTARNTTRDEGGNDEVKALRRELEQMRERLTENRTEDLKVALEGAVAGAFDSSEDMGVLLKKATELDGPDEEGKRRKTLLEEVEEKTMARIRRRSEMGGKFRREWLREEGERAAAEVAAKYRTVIGDPNKLRRVPETDAGGDEFRRREPVKDPVFEKGDGMSGARQKALDFTEGTLLEMLDNVEKGEASKI